jgi:hypothetical protein
MPWHIKLVVDSGSGCILLVPLHRLPEKVAADRDGLLVAFAHSEIGVLNNVVELWRYPSAAACLRCAGVPKDIWVLSPM